LNYEIDDIKTYKIHKAQIVIGKYSIKDIGIEKDEDAPSLVFIEDCFL
jgi:hypothetical protein